MDLSCLPLVFSFILTVASRLLHLYNTDDQTSRLMMKSFSTVRDTQRGSQSYMEKRRGRREIEVTRRRGGVKRREATLASNQFPKCFPQPRTPSGISRNSHQHSRLCPSLLRLPVSPNCEPLRNTRHFSLISISPVLSTRPGEDASVNSY